MNKDQLKKALISILIGSAVMMLGQVFSLILDLLKTYQQDLVPPVTGMVYFIKSWKTNPIG